MIVKLRRFTLHGDHVRALFTPRNPKNCFARRTTDFFRGRRHKTRRSNFFVRQAPSGEITQDEAQVPEQDRIEAFQGLGGVGIVEGGHLLLDENGWHRMAPWPKIIRLRVRMFAPSTVMPMGMVW